MIKSICTGSIISSLAMIFMLMMLCSPALSCASEQVVRFAFQDRIGSVLPIAAYKNGYFSDHGIRMKALRFSSGPACMEALYSGSADIATMGDTTALILTAKSPDFIIIASHATGEHRHRIMVAQTSDIHSLQDLVGRRIGVKKGTSTYGGLLNAFRKAGIPPARVMITDLSPATMIDALNVGSLDAFAASEPTPSLAEEKGARDLTSLGGLGNEYPIFILAKKKWVDEKRPLLIQFLKALQDGEDFNRHHSDESISMMARETGLAPHTARSVMGRHQYHLRLDRSILDSLKQTAAFLENHGIIAKTPVLTTVTASELVESLE
jgi:sulfonate transport system substrate-binding protein